MDDRNLIHPNEAMDIQVNRPENDQEAIIQNDNEVRILKEYLQFLKNAVIFMINFSIINIHYHVSEMLPKCRIILF